MVTTRTHLRRISRVDGEHLHPGPERLVFNELAQLVEGPRVVESSLRSAQTLIGALTDPLQLFQGNRMMRRLRRLYDLLADLMVHPLLVATFFATKPFENMPRILAR